MNKVKGVCLIVVTFLCIIVGFLLPHQIALYQDHQLDNQVTSYKMEQVEFQNTFTFESVLTIMSDNYNEVEKNSKNTNYTEKQIINIVKDFFSQLEKKGLSFMKKKKIYEKGARPFLAVSSTETVAIASVWEYIAMDEEKTSYRILVDDLTGKILSFEISYAYVDSEMKIESRKVIEEKAKLFCDFLNSYYEGYEISYKAYSVNTEVAGKNTSSTYVDGSNRIGEVGLYRLSLKKAKNETFYARFEYGCQYISFSFY